MEPQPHLIASDSNTDEIDIGAIMCAYFQVFQTLREAYYVCIQNLIPSLSSNVCSVVFSLRFLTVQLVERTDAFQHKSLERHPAS